MGKGSARRPTDEKKFGEGWDRTFNESDELVVGSELVEVPPRYQRAEPGGCSAGRPNLPRRVWLEHRMAENGYMEVVWFTEAMDGGVTEEVVSGEYTVKVCTISAKDAEGLSEAPWDDEVMDREMEEPC